MRTLLTITFALLTMGCSSCGSEGGAKPAAPGGGNGDVVAVTVSSVSKTITPDIFGYNTQSIKGPGWEKTQFIDKIAELSPGNFRYPGGTVGNFWEWRTGYYNDIGKEVQVIKPSAEGAIPYKLEHVKVVCDRTGAMPVYMLNMLTAKYEDQLAMLKHAQAIGLPVKYIEMGNEFYLNDHPETYNYLKAYPETTDYNDSCRIWTTRLRREFPDARISMIGVNHPSSWVNRQRAREWNGIIMQNMQGIECDAMTIHIYAKNNLEAPTTDDMIGQVLRHVEEDRVLDPSIDPKYPLWITEYNFEGGSNPFPGQWVHGLAATIMSAQLICTPRVEMICFFNLTAGLSASAIYDNDYVISGKTAPKFSLSATGEGLKMLAKAQKNATSVRTLSFDGNPKTSTQKNGEINTLYGYKFDGAGPKVLLINIGQEQAAVSLEGLGFTPSAFEQINTSSPQAAVTGPGSLNRLAKEIGASQKSIVLRPNSITVVK